MTMFISNDTFFGTYLLHVVHDDCGKFRMYIFYVFDLVEVWKHGTGVGTANKLEFDTQHLKVTYSAAAVERI